MCKLHVVCPATDNMPTTNCKHYRVSSALLPMHAFPSVKAERTSECLYGEMLRNIPASVEILFMTTMIRNRPTVFAPVAPSFLMNPV